MAAAVRQHDACRTALDLAARQITRPQADHLPYLALDAAHLARWRGNCLIQFGDTATIGDLTTALTGMDGTFTRAEAGLRCDLAAALHAAGDRHEARQHLRRATELAQLTGSARQRRRITSLARRIGTAAWPFCASSPRSPTSTPEFQIFPEASSSGTDASGTHSIRSASFSSTGSVNFSGSRPTKITCSESTIPTIG